MNIYIIAIIVIILLCLISTIVSSMLSQKTTSSVVVVAPVTSPALKLPSNVNYVTKKPTGIVTSKADQWNYYNNTVVAENEYNISGAQEYCKTVCSATEGCVGFNYDNTNQVCGLISSVSEVKYDPSKTFYGIINIPSLDNYVKWGKHINVDLDNDNNLYYPKYIDVNNVEGCKTACLKAQGCKGIVTDLNYQNCYAKLDTGGQRYSGNAVFFSVDK